jgi:hypothetical protein
MKKMKIRYSEPINSNTFELDSHPETPRRVLVEAIALTAEVCGQALSPAAARLLAEDLADFGGAAILNALARCRMELQGPLKTADILARLDDGRPRADEAWAMMPKSESESVVWTDEMAHAWGVALPLLGADDVAGTAATAYAEFCSAYEKAVLEARIRRVPLRWIPSLGSDVARRESVLLDAVKKRRLSVAHVRQLLPPESMAAIADGEAGQAKLKKLH